MDAIEETGYCLWDEYYRQMQRRFHTGSRQRKQFWHNRFRKTFLTMAEKCQKYKLDPGDYIRTSLDIVQKSHQYITPKDFSTEEAFQRYYEHARKYGINPVASWLTQVNMLTDMECRLIPKSYDSEEAILMNPMTPFKAWFRVLYPDMFSEPLYRVYGELAWTELAESRRLREFVCTKCLRNLQELARRLGSLDVLANTERTDGTT